MAEKYYTILTSTGKALIAEALSGGNKLLVDSMAVGDGGGRSPSPDAGWLSLINEKYRAPVNQVVVDPKNKSQIIIELIIPENTGGWWIREAGVYDKFNNLIAVAKCPETFKPVLAQGSGRNSVIRMVIIVSEVAAVEMKTDPTTVIATRDYVNSVINEHENSRSHPDATLDEKGFVTLSNQTNSNDQDKAATSLAVKNAVAEAIRAAWELDNPVGTVRFFAQKIDPNKLYPWSVWTYTGENKSIRVAKADGSNVGKTAGSDTATIARENLPAVQVDVSGTAASASLTGKETKEAGAAQFNTYRFGSTGNDNQVGRFSMDDVAMGDIPVAVSIPAHKHTFDLDVPERSVTGKTANLGEGKTISIVEAHTLLMCWARTA